MHPNTSYDKGNATLIGDFSLFKINIAGDCNVRVLSNRVCKCHLSLNIFKKLTNALIYDEKLI